LNAGFLGLTIPWVNKAELYAERVLIAVHQIPILNTSVIPFGRVVPYKPSVTSGRGPWSEATTEVQSTIQLPPLSSPKSSPPHRTQAPERDRRVWYQPLKRRIPSTGPRPRTDAGLGLPPSVFCAECYPSGNNPQTPSEPAKPKLTGLQAPSQAASGEIRCRTPPTHVLGALGRNRRHESGRRPCDQETEPTLPNE
jgi:hypothetical protein